MKIVLHRFTLTELLIVISIMIILISLLVPALSNAKASVRRSSCSNNLRQFGIAVNSYDSDNNGYLPCSETDYKLWDYLLMDYVNYDYANYNARKDFSIFHCPSGIPYPSYSHYRTRGYGYNQAMGDPGYGSYSYMHRLSGITMPAITVMMTDHQYTTGTEHFVCGGYNSNSYVSPSAASAYIAYRHLHLTNVLFADAHVKPCEKGTWSASYNNWRPRGARWYNDGTIY